MLNKSYIYCRVHQGRCAHYVVTLVIVLLRNHASSCIKTLNRILRFNNILSARLESYFISSCFCVFLIYYFDKLCCWFKYWGNFLICGQNYGIKKENDVFCLRQQKCDTVLPLFIHIGAPYFTLYRTKISNKSGQNLKKKKKMDIPG